jgi:hypothetical protein
LEAALRDPNNPKHCAFLDMHRINPADYLKNEQQRQQTPATPKSPAIDPSLVKWEKFEPYGISRENLEKSGEINKLLDFKKTGLMPVSMKLDGEAQSLRTDGRFALRKNEDGTFSPSVHLVRHKPELDRPYFGVQFTEEDKQRLLTSGNLGRIVEAEFKKGEKTPVLLSLDKLTNELVAFRSDRLKVPETYRGVQLSDEQKQWLAEGKAVKLEGLISKQGKPYHGELQFNADKRYFEFLYNGKSQEQSQKQENGQKDIPKTFRKKELTEDQRSSLREGKTVYTGELLDAKGKKYCGYITLNKETGKTDFMFPKDYKDALAAGKVIPDDRCKTQVEVNSKGKTTEETKNLTEPLKQGQTKPDEKQAEKLEEKKETQKRGRKVS